MPRISDIYAALPAMTGKMELEYEGEQIGATPHGERPDQTRAPALLSRDFSSASILPPTVRWFDEGNKLRSPTPRRPMSACAARQRSRADRLDPVPLEFQRSEKAKLVSACEFVLEGLYAQNKISVTKRAATRPRRKPNAIGAE